MRGAGLILGGSVTMCACAASSALGGSALIKAPIEQQCASHGLKGCPELVDGVMLYVDGDEPAAKRQLKLGASKNVPADLQRFAQAISTVLPAKTGGFVTEILTGQITQDHPENDPSKQVATSDEASQDSESPARFQSGFHSLRDLKHGRPAD